MNKNSISLDKKNDEIIPIFEIIEKLIKKHKDLLNGYNSDLREINEYLFSLEKEIKEIEKSINEDLFNIEKTIKENIINKNIVENNKYLKEEIYKQYLKIQKITEKNIIIKDDELISNIQNNITDLINKEININVKDILLKILSILRSIIFKIDELKIKEKIFLENKQKLQISESIKMNEEAILYWQQELLKIKRN